MHKAEKEIQSKDVRNLGKLYLAFSALIAIAVVYKLSQGKPFPWQGYVAELFAFLGLVCLIFGAKAKVIYQAWAKLGVFLSRVISPIVLGVIYYVVLTPFALVYRRLKKDPLGLTPDPSKSSYWNEPEEKRSSPARLLKQY